MILFFPLVSTNWKYLVSLLALGKFQNQDILDDKKWKPHQQCERVRPLLIPHSLVFNNPNFLCFFSHRAKAAEEKLILADNFFLLILLRITHPWYITGGGLYTMHVIQPFICKMRQTARYLHKWKDDASLRKKKNIPRRGYSIRL